MNLVRGEYEMVDKLKMEWEAIGDFRFKIYDEQRCLVKESHIDLAKINTRHCDMKEFPQFFGNLILNRIEDLVRDQQAQVLKNEVDNRSVKRDLGKVIENFDGDL